MSACPSRVKTCENCASAKIRCIRKAASTICDRCLRLNKSCYFRPARLRQGRQQKETRLESLERKVADLLGQIQEKHDVPDSKKDDIPDSKKHGIIDRGIITLDQAAILLESFRQSMLPHFPFVVLPPDITAAELRVHNPFLFLAILAVSATDNTTLQRALDDEVRSILADRTVLGPVQPSLETLQGLLVVLAWSQHQSQHHPKRNGPPAFFTYLHLAIGMVVELELDRPVHLRKDCPRMTVQTITTQAQQAQPTDVLRAQQRAAIGCFILSSCASLIKQKTCAFPWSSHLEDFAKELAHSPEVASDRSLIHLVRLQHIAEQIDRISTDSSFERTARVATESNMDMDTFLATFQTFQTQLQDYTTLLSPQWTHNNFLLSSQLHTVNLYLCQVTLFEKHLTSHLSPTLRAEIFSQGLISAKSSFNAHLALPLGTERRMIYTPWLQSGFNLILSCKLTLLAVSDDSLRSQPRVQSLCAALNMSQVLNVCIERHFTRVQRAGQTKTKTKTGFDYPGWLRWLQDWFLQQSSLYGGSSGRGSEMAAATTPGAVTASHSILLQRFNITDLSHMGFDESRGSDIVDSWPCYSDIYASDNIFSGWMDLSALSK